MTYDFSSRETQETMMNGFSSFRHNILSHNINTEADASCIYTDLCSCLWCRRHFLSSSPASFTLITWPSSSQIFSNCTLGLPADGLSLKPEAALSERGASLSLLAMFSAMSSRVSVTSSSCRFNNKKNQTFTRILKCTCRKKKHPSVSRERIRRKFT